MSQDRKSFTPFRLALVLLNWAVACFSLMCLTLAIIPFAAYFNLSGDHLVAIGVGIVTLIACRMVLRAARRHERG